VELLIDAETFPVHWKRSIMELAPTHSINIVEN